MFGVVEENDSSPTILLEGGGLSEGDSGDGEGVAASGIPWESWPNKKFICGYMIYDLRIFGNR